MNASPQPPDEQEVGMNPNDSSAELQPGGRCVLGIHLDIDSLHLVEVCRGRIAKWANVPYPTGLHPGAKDFPAFLKTSLAGFHAGSHHVPLWVVGPTPSLQVRFLSLPKARPRQMANLAYWTFRKEIPFDAAQTIFDYDVEGNLAANTPAKKTEVTAYTVTQADVDALADLCERAGLRAEGILIPSFALRNLFHGQAPTHAGPVLGLFVGEDASSLLFFKDKQVVAHRVFKTGMNVMLDVLRDRHPDWSPAKTYRTIRAALASSASTEPAMDNDRDSEARSIGETVQTAFTRLVQQVERSMSAYLVGRGNEEIRHIYIAGALAGLPALVQALGAKLGLVSQPLNLFLPGHLENGSPPPADRGRSRHAGDCPRGGHVGSLPDPQPAPYLCQAHGGIPRHPLAAGRDLRRNRRSRAAARRGHLAGPAQSHLEGRIEFHPATDRKIRPLPRPGLDRSHGGQGQRP